MLFTVAGAGFVTLGLAMGWYGLRPLAVVPSVLRATVRDPSEVTEAGSFAACRGVANESSEAVSAPFTGTRCLGFEFEVTERQPFGIGVPWFQAHLDDGVAARPFALGGSAETPDDPTGAPDAPTGNLAVVPSAKRFALDTDSTVLTVGAGETPPERVQRFVDVRDELEPVARWMRIVPGLGTRRYVERRIDPGEEYLVAGTTERRRNETVLAGDLVISDRSPRGFALARLRRAVFPTAIALGFVAVGVGGIAL